MRIFLDTANIDQIREAAKLGIISGVTTNPSLVSKEGTADYEATIKEICSIISGPISAEVLVEGVEPMIKQAQQIGGQMQNLSEELKDRRATGTAGGGMVEIEVNGLLELLRCRIDEQLIVQGDRELIEDLIAAAVNQAITKGKELHTEALKELTGGLELPGVQEALAKLTKS